MKVITAILPALIAAFIGSWVGAQTALSRFKKERAFERRLQWYERMNTSLLDAAKELAVAATIERGIEKGIDTESAALTAWSRVQLKHLDVNRVTAEGVLYAKKQSFRTLWDETGALQDLANKTNAFHSLAGEALQDVEIVKRRLRHAANVLAEDIRAQLGLEALGIHPRDEIGSTAPRCVNCRIIYAESDQYCAACGHWLSKSS
jgi:rRNA maturation endonuclease Nob1